MDRQTVSTEGIADEWADRYGALRTSGPTAANAWLGIPLVLMALLGMLWSIPMPDALSQPSAAINAATMWVMASFVYYCILSIRIALGSLLLLVVLMLPSAWLERAGLPIWPFASALFAPAFAWQLVETRRATGKLRIFANMQYLMLGPVWLLRAVYRRAGVPY